LVTDEHHSDELVAPDGSRKDIGWRKRVAPATRHTGLCLVSLGGGRRLRLISRGVDRRRVARDDQGDAATTRGDQHRSGAGDRGSRSPPGTTHHGSDASTRLTIDHPWPIARIRSSLRGGSSSVWSAPSAYP